MKKGGTVRVEEGIGNVFADLGFPNPEREQLKAQLMVRGHSGNFSVERLMEFLTALGQDIEIVVRPKRRRAR